MITTAIGAFCTTPGARGGEQAPARAAQAGETRMEEAQMGEARFGVNLAGAEFAGHVVPGVYGVNYTYPSAEELEYYRTRGRTLIRLPFLWERMQRALNGPLDTEELTRLKAVLRAAREKKIEVILDVHNYGRYRFAGEEKTEPATIGSERIPYAAFADLWSRLAAAFKDEPAVYAYGLMNEPYEMGNESRWPLAAQAAIEAIRKIDRKTTIMVAGDNFSSARSWQTGPNGKINEKVHDPCNNLVFEAHCYFDQNHSGSYAKNYDDEGGLPDTGIDSVRPFVEWCQAKGVRGFIGEFGIPDNDTRWLVTLDRFVAYLKANKMSATYWAGGPWWGKDALSIEPTYAPGADKGDPKGDPIDRPQMLILRQYPG